MGFCLLLSQMLASLQAQISHLVSTYEPGGGRRHATSRHSAGAHRGNSSGSDGQGVASRRPNSRRLARRKSSWSDLRARAPVELKAPHLLQRRGSSSRGFDSVVGAASRRQRSFRALSRSRGVLSGGFMPPPRTASSLPASSAFVSHPQPPAYAHPSIVRAHAKTAAMASPKKRSSAARQAPPPLVASVVSQGGVGGMASLPRVDSNKSK